MTCLVLYKIVFAKVFKVVRKFYSFCIIRDIYDSEKKLMRVYEISMKMVKFTWVIV